MQHGAGKTELLQHHADDLRKPDKTSGNLQSRTVPVHVVTLQSNCSNVQVILSRSTWLPYKVIAQTYRLHCPGARGYLQRNCSNVQVILSLCTWLPNNILLKRTGHTVPVHVVTPQSNCSNVQVILSRSTWLPHKVIAKTSGHTVANTVKRQVRR